MSIFTGAMIYVVIWWIVFFAALPVGVRTAAEAGEATQPGFADSAPVRPRLWLKAAVTTVLAAVLWGVFYYGYLTGFFGLEEWVKS
jgi:predicted secreted protein